MVSEDDLIECRLCGCRFFSENDYLGHMDRFGVEGHQAKLKVAHYYYYGGRQ